MNRIEIEEILFDEKTIEQKVQELGARISLDYTGREIVLISILKGAITFTADLMRRITVPVDLDFVRAASYGTGTVSKGISVLKDIETDIKGRDVLLVDCIIDSGETLDCLLKRYKERGPRSLKTVVLIDKKPRRTVEVKLDYTGFEIPDRFVVGYGMDCNEQYRNLPYIAAVKVAGR